MSDSTDTQMLASVTDLAPARTPNVELLTSSSARVARACRRHFRIAYRLGYRPRVVDEALRFGSLMHHGLEAWWNLPREWRLAGALQAIQEKSADPFDRVRADILMRGYDARWGLEQFEVLGVEVPFECELRNPATGRVSKTWRLAGKVDAIVRDIGGRVLLVEHKTASGDIGLGSDYWKRLRLDAQVSIYFEGARSLGHEVQGCLYDVIGKPLLRPLKQGQKREAAETPEEHAARISEAVAAEPNRYFQRGEVARLESELAESLDDLWALTQELNEDEKHGRAPRNPDACMQWGRPCRFWEICTGVASLDDEARFVRVPSVHPELAVEAAP